MSIIQTNWRSQVIKDTYIDTKGLLNKMCKTSNILPWYNLINRLNFKSSKYIDRGQVGIVMSCLIHKPVWKHLLTSFNLFWITSVLIFNLNLVLFFLKYKVTQAIYGCLRVSKIGYGEGLEWHTYFCFPYNWLNFRVVILYNLEI